MPVKGKITLGFVSSWLVIGMGLILAVAVAILAAMNFNREKKVTEQVLSEKGAALIRSFEAGTRTGMLGKFGGEARLQTLLTETAAQKDILYIALVDPAGKVLAHNDPRQIGRQFLPPAALASLGVTGTAAWRTIDRDGRPVAFEVYKTFLPLPGRPGRESRHERMMGREQGGKEEGVWCQPGWMGGLPQDRILDPRQPPVIFIGMDPGPYVEARQEDFKLTLLTSAIVVLLGMAGVVSLYWAQRYLRSRQLLQDTRAFAAEMVANLPEGIIVAGTDRRLTFVNDIAAAMLGLARQGLPGRTVTEALPAELAELILLPAGGNRKVVERELPLGGRRAGKLTLAASATSIVTEEGNLVGSMLILRDLTQVRRLQETVRRQEKLAAVGNLAAGVAHEVRNPLSSIKGYATYFASLFAEGSDQKKAALVMTAEVERLNRVISELLELARPSDIRPRDTDVAFLLNSSLRLVQQEAEAAGVRIETVIAQGIPPFPLDPDRITQALLNLYLNAIQAMSEGGQLTIRADETAAGLEIEVRDTGGGIQAEVLDKIFDPYYTTKNTGTGLGLAVVQKVVEAHGGTVRVDSEPDRGTSFTLVLPRGEGAEGRP